MLQNATNTKDESTIAEAHYWLGCTYEPYFGEMEEAMRHLTTAVEMARKTGNRPLEARSLNAIGSSLVWGLDTIDEGRVRLEESSKICREVGDRITEAHNLQMLGIYHNWKGEFNQAKESLNKALASAEEVGSIPISMYKLWFLSYALAGNGEYNEAIRTGQKCLQLARDHGDWSLVSMVLNTLGWMYHDLSNIELALKYDNEALENAKGHQRSRASGAVPMSLLNLGMDYLYKNDNEKAEAYFKEVINQYQQHRVGWWRIEARILLGRGAIALAKGDCQQALGFAEDSLAISEKAGAKKHVANGLKLKAEVLAKMGNIEEAVKLTENALNLAQQVGNPTQLWQIHYSLGLLEEKLGDAQEANEHYAKAIALLEAVASQLNDAVLKGTLLASQKTRAVRDAHDRTKSVQERVVGLERSEHAYLQAALTALDEVTTGEAFDVQLDITNATTEPAMLVRLEIPIPSTLKIAEIIPKYEFKDTTINLESKRLEPKKVESIKIRATASESGIVRINPRIVYVNGLGEFKVCKPDPITITVYPLGKFQFKTNYAETVFEFLTKAFMEDYMRRRLPMEKSGWRTLMQIVNNTKASRSSLYGPRSRRGPALSELERRGVVEIRIFLEERGRGGKITKTRLAYEKDIVKRYVDQHVVKIKKKQQEYSEP
jgi:tetratricopeptide (TPR) repeat protein